VGAGALGVVTLAMLLRVACPLFGYRVLIRYRRAAAAGAVASVYVVPESLSGVNRSKAFEPIAR
jgi:hypothetical protein